MSDAKVIAVAEDGIEVTDAMVGSWCEAYEGETLPAGYRYEGAVKQGRPRMFEDGTSTVVVRLPTAQKEAIGREARQRGMSVSGYVREILTMRDTAAV